MDQIRHCIIFNQVGEGYSGLYRVRAVNCLGEAECEAELSFDGEGGDGNEMYLPPLWREKRRLTWRDEDMRKKPFMGYNEPELSPEEIDAMKKGSGLVPLSRITEYLASLPDYVPSNKFNNMERIPFKAGVDEHDYRPTKKGGSPRFPGKFQKGKIVHHAYNVDGLGRILPKWHNKNDPRSRDSSDWRWKPVHPDLYLPDFPPRGTSPEPPPIWETQEDIMLLVKWLRSMGCRVTHVEMKATDGQQQNKSNINLNQQNSAANTNQHHKSTTYNNTVLQSKSNTAINTAVKQENQKQDEQKIKKQNKVAKFSYTNKNESTNEPESETMENKQKQMARSIAQEAQTQNLSSQAHSKSNSKFFKNNIATSKYEANEAVEDVSVYESHVTTSQTKSEQFFTSEMTTQQIYNKQDNLSFPELEKLAQPPPALPPKTKIMHSPSR